MVVVLENRSYDAVIGSAGAPYINQLATEHGIATAMYATAHPSLPNYLELIAGTTFGITSDCTSCSVDGTTLVDQLTAASVDWRAYIEGALSPCYTGVDTGEYAKRHNPFVYVRHLVADPQSCSRVVPFSGLTADLGGGRLPPFAWVSPDLCHDGHSCDNAAVDQFLQGVVPQILASDWYKAGGVVILTWDEASTGDSSGCCTGTDGGHVPTIVLASNGPSHGRLNTPVDHAGILRSVEKVYGLGSLGDAASPASGDLMPLIQG